MDRTITVTGTGVSTARPDAAVIDGEIAGTIGTYDGAVSMAAEALGSLRKAIGDAGFDMDDLRTTAFSVDTVYTTVDGKPRLSGYRYFHGITMTVDSDPEVLGGLLQAMTMCADAPEFRVRYVVSDPSDALKAARQAAVKDAKRRARELASSAGVSLGELVSIEYQSQHGSPAPRARMMAAMAVDATPRDVEFRDSVTMSWAIL